MLVQIFTAVTAGLLVVGVSSFGWRALRSSSAGVGAAWRSATQRISASRTRHHREREIQAATEANESIVIGVQGFEPALVVRDGGCPSQELVFTDIQAYQRAMEARQVPPGSTYWHPTLPHLGERRPCGRC